MRNSSENWIVSGRALKGLKRYEESLSKINHALKLQPMNIHTLKMKKELLIRLGRESELQRVQQEIDELSHQFSKYFMVWES